MTTTTHPNRGDTMLTEQERERLTMLFGWVPEPEPLEQMLAAVEAIVAAREGVWRAPIEALAADPSAMFEAMYGAASDPDGVLMLSVIAAVNALRAVLWVRVSAPGNEAGQ